MDDSAECIVAIVEDAFAYVFYTPKLSGFVVRVASGYAWFELRVGVQFGQVVSVQGGLFDEPAQAVVLLQAGEGSLAAAEFTSQGVSLVLGEYFTIDFYMLKRGQARLIVF